MLGVFVNVAAVLLGSTVGLLFRKGIPERVSKAVMLALSLCTLYIGIDGALAGSNTIVLILSIVFGTILGTLIDIDDKINRVGQFLEQKLKEEGEPSSDCQKTRKWYYDRAAGGRVKGGKARPSRSIKQNFELFKGQNSGLSVSKRLFRHAEEGEPSSIAQGFMTGSLLFCIGAMTIVGSLNSGLSGDHTLIYTKSILDMISSCILSSTMGIGIIFSSLFILVYQGALVLCAGLLRNVLTDPALISEITCAGSVMIIGISLNMLGLTKIKVANLLPALLFVPLFYYLAQLLPM